MESLGDLADAERACLVQACADAGSAEALAACRAAQCAERPDVWQLQPKSIRHQGQTVFVQAQVHHEPGGYGTVDSVRDSEAYVGCTVVTSAGVEIDLAVTTIFPDTLDAPFTLASEVGPDVRDVIFGVWDRKIEPCNSDRMGCQEYGFLLDGSLATWPPTVYVDGTRQRIPPATVDIAVRDGGAGPGFAAERDRAVAALSTELELFGAKLGSVTSGIAPAPAATATIAHRDGHDRWLARRIAEAVVELSQVKDAVQFQDGLPAHFVVTIGGDAAVHATAKAGCATATDAEYDRCVTALAGAQD